MTFISAIALAAALQEPEPWIPLNDGARWEGHVTARAGEDSSEYDATVEARPASDGDG